MSKVQINQVDYDIFNKLKEDLLNIDPVYFAEKYLTLDGAPFRLNGNGYKALSDIYRYVGIKSLEPNAKPLIICKSRQTGLTTMCSVLELYFMCSGIFGVGKNPPIRIMHTFPQLELAAAYSKTKLSQIIASAKQSNTNEDPKNFGGKRKNHIQSLMDTSSQSNDSLHFKQFVNGNHLWVESIGLDADRIMGRTCDVIMIDECFPSWTKITTSVGKKTIGNLYNDFIKNKPLPLIKTFNEKSQTFEFKKITNAWKKDKKSLVELNISGRKIQCTENHKFLTENGWQEARDITIGTLLKSSNDTTQNTKALNDDQYQVILGSFLGDGCIRREGNSTFRMSVIHSMEQNDYCEWKADLFRVKTNFVEKNGYAGKPAKRFNTKNFGLNKEFPKTKTTCPQWVLNEIDARGIAIWFMDDGSSRVWKNGGDARLSTCSFDEDSQIRFVKKFKDLGIECNYKKYNDYFYINFNTKGFSNLCDLIRPYIHTNISYKLIQQNSDIYKWDNNYKKYSWCVLNSISIIDKQEIVYDIEVEDNHNFVLSPNGKGNTLGGPIAHNCQKTTDQAIGNATKILNTAKYGNKGVQVMFGTPRRKGSSFHTRWTQSTQQYYYLGCKDCKKHFPLYTPGSDDWEKIWLHGFIVKCTHCGCEQDKRQATERGKWVAMKSEDDVDCKMIGFHINILYMPMFTKEDVLKEKPGIHPVNTERVYQNEVMGEFFQGDSSPITIDEIREKCGDFGRKMRSSIGFGEEPIVICGIDYGAKADLEQLANPDRVKSVGQSYSTVVILTCKGPGLLSIEFAAKFKRNDFEGKKGFIDQLMRQYSIQLCVADIGYSNDFSQVMQSTYGDRYLVSRTAGKVNNYAKFNKDVFPKEIAFEKDYYIGELYDQMKRGMIRFPYGDFEKIAWLVEHCASMEIKPSISRSGDASIHYVKGSTPNDGYAALLNAYLAYKYIISKGFTEKGVYDTKAVVNGDKALITGGYISRKF